MHRSGLVFLLPIRRGAHRLPKRCSDTHALSRLEETHRDQAPSTCRHPGALGPRHGTYRRLGREYRQARVARGKFYHTAARYARSSHYAGARPLRRAYGHYRVERRQFYHAAARFVRAPRHGNLKGLRREFGQFRSARAGFHPLVIWSLMRATDGPNRFGSDPLSTQASDALTGGAHSTSTDVART